MCTSVVLKCEYVIVRLYARMCVYARHGIVLRMRYMKCVCEKFPRSIPVLVTVTQTPIIGRQNNDLYKTTGMRSSM